VEDSDENYALIETIKKTENDDIGDSFDSKALKSELKNSEKGSIEYKLLKKVESLINNKAKLIKEVKVEEKELSDSVQERILNLTDEEVDTLIYKKCFGDIVNQMVALVQISLKEELKLLQELENRYSDTLSEIDIQIEKMIKDFEMLKNELVVE